MICAVPGCTALAKRYGHYCNTHAARDRRHGHPLQQTVGAVELRPYREAVRRRVQRNAEAPVWRTLEEIWARTVDQCEARLREYRAGKPAVELSFTHKRAWGPRGQHPT